MLLIYLGIIMLNDHTYFICTSLANNILSKPSLDNLSYIDKYVFDFFFIGSIFFYNDIQIKPYLLLVFLYFSDSKAWFVHDG